MHDPEITETFGQVAPRNAGPVAIQHRFDEQPVVTCSHADMALTSGQQGFDPFPLIISKGVTTGHMEAGRCASHEASLILSIDDRP